MLQTVNKTLYIIIARKIAPRLMENIKKMCELFILNDSALTVQIIGITLL